MADKILTPQQELFLAEYTNPKSENFGNALRSALKAGYSEEYANNITGHMPDWLSENVGDMRRLRKAEKNLSQVQELNVETEDGKVLTDVLRERTKVDLFLAERLGKHKYSQRNELTGKDGQELKISFDSSFKENDSSQ